MTRRWSMGVSMVLCAAFATVAYGQEGAPQWYFIVQETVKPSMVAEYESAGKQMIEAMNEHGIDPEKVNYKTVSGPEMGYTYVIPLENFAAMDTMMADWQAAVASMGDTWTELETKASAATSHRASFHVVQRPDLSHWPDEPRIPTDQVKMFHYGFYYILPGKERDLEEVARDYADLYRRKGIDQQWTLYQSVTGDDLPLYVAVFPARSQADYHAHAEKIQEMLGEEGEALGERVMACTRRIELKWGTIRPELSYPKPE